MWGKIFGCGGSGVSFIMFTTFTKFTMFTTCTTYTHSPPEKWQHDGETHDS